MTFIMERGVINHGHVCSCKNERMEKWKGALYKLRNSFSVLARLNRLTIQWTRLRSADRHHLTTGTVRQYAFVISSLRYPTPKDILLIAPNLLR